ncbi:MAG: RNA polymerase sigma factor SigJ [Acidobacteria bacterium]|nr:MAG: RNA polymerase sigma factor SigJ [Acidobacteriota bacterium]REK04519.1 MAG: RNA polymerase sigma factor SigJ [Acidobacteriota bacterium]
MVAQHADEDISAHRFEEQRRRLLGLAYRMLGSAAEAEDVVQDAWLRWSAVSEPVEDPAAYLVRVTTRLCLDRLKSARQRREVYVGPWLPEPVPDAASFRFEAAMQGSATPEREAELADDLSFALLLALERLSPAERAAFLLHDVFDLGHREIAASLGRSEAATRQLASRARREVRSARPGPTPTTAELAVEHRRLLSGFRRAVEEGDVASFRQLLTEDAVALSDGGGEVAAALNPIRGADKVTRFVFGIAAKHLAAGATVETREIELNGLPGLVVLVDGALDVAISLAAREGRAETLYLVRNPAKLELVRRFLRRADPVGRSRDEG